MSGHSKWSTIKRKKEVTDNARGKVFSKLSKAISVAVKTGGGESVGTNYKLKMAIEAAKSANMPKANIERAISKGTNSGDMTEVVYEGYGPENISVIVEAATDNRNRTAQELKGFFDKGGGTLGGPGSVAFNFEQKGLIVVNKQNSDSQILALIDMGVDDIEDTGDLEVLVAPDKLHQIKTKIEEAGFKVLDASLIQDPKTYVQVQADKSEKVLKFLQNLNDHDDVQKVFANVDFQENNHSK